MSFDAVIQKVCDEQREEWSLYAQGVISKPSRQKEIGATGVPGLRVLVEGGRACWCSRYRDPVTGKRNSLVHGPVGKVSFPSAVQMHMRMREEIAAGISPAAGRITVSMGFFDHYVPNAERCGKRTLKEDVAKFRSVIEPVIGGVRLSDVRSKQLDLLADRIRAVKAPATAERYVALVKAIFRDFRKMGLMESNPAERIEMKKSSNPRRVAPDSEALAALGRVIRNEPKSVSSALFQALMMTGARLSELRLSRLDQYDRSAGVLRLATSKSGRPQEIMLPDAFWGVYDWLESVRPAECSFLFPSTRGGDRPIGYPGKYFKRLIQLAGLDGFIIHDLRRVFASNAVEAGVSPLEVSRLLRHSSLLVTEKHYLVTGKMRLLTAANDACMLIQSKLAQSGQCTAPIDQQQATEEAS